MENVKRNSPQIPLVFLVNECTIVEDEFKLTAKIIRTNTDLSYVPTAAACFFLFTYLGCFIFFYGLILKANQIEVRTSLRKTPIKSKRIVYHCTAKE